MSDRPTFRYFFGLGNPGVMYLNNRHNIGQKMMKSLNHGFHLIGVHLMNESGKDLREMVEKGKMFLAETLVIQDDLYLPVGEYRFVYNSSDGGHKGIRSCQRELQTNEFWRLKIGIGRPEDAADFAEYCLSDPTTEEQKILDELIIELREII